MVIKMVRVMDTRAAWKLAAKVRLTKMAEASVLRSGRCKRLHDVMSKGIVLPDSMGPSTSRPGTRSSIGANPCLRRDLLSSISFQ